MTFREVMSVVNSLYYFDGFSSVTIDIENGHIMLMAECDLEEAEA